jgi:protoheme IX farnesyltransferase
VAEAQIGARHLVGSLSGAMPPVIGYCAVSNSFDLAA